MFQIPYAYVSEVAYPKWGRLVVQTCWDPMGSNGELESLMFFCFTGFEFWGLPVLILDQLKAMRGMDLQLVGWI